MKKAKITQDGAYDMAVMLVGYFYGFRNANDIFADVLRDLNAAVNSGSQKNIDAVLREYGKKINEHHMSTALCDVGNEKLMDALEKMQEALLEDDRVEIVGDSSIETLTAREIIDYVKGKCGVDMNRQFKINLKDKRGIIIKARKIMSMA